MDFLLVFALSLDTFFAAVACGADKIRIPFRSSLVMASVGTGCLALSLLLRGLLEQVLPYDWIRLAGFVLLFLLGITALFQAGIKAALSRRAQKKEPLTFTCFNCRCGGCLSAVYPRDEKRTGKVGAANFEADRRAVGSKIKKRTGRKGNLPYGPFFIRIPFSLRGCHSPSASGMGVPLGEGGRLHAAIPCPHIP